MEFWDFLGCFFRVLVDFLLIYTVVRIYTKAGGFFLTYGLVATNVLSLDLFSRFQVLIYYVNMIALLIYVGLLVHRRVLARNLILKVEQSKVDPKSKLTHEITSRLKAVDFNHLLNLCYRINLLQLYFYICALSSLLSCKVWVWSGGCTILYRATRIVLDSKELTYYYESTNVRNPFKFFVPETSQVEVCTPLFRINVQAAAISSYTISKDTTGFKQVKNILLHKRNYLEYRFKSLGRFPEYMKYLIIPLWFYYLFTLVRQIYTKCMIIIRLQRSRDLRRALRPSDVETLLYL